MNTSILIHDLANCIESLSDCVNGCLKSRRIEKMRECVLSSLDCEDSCGTALLLLTSNNSVDHVIGNCIESFQKCENECLKYNTEYCQQCAEACRKCLETCQSYLQVAA